MKFLFRKLLTTRSTSFLKRCLHLTSCNSIEPDDGKTTVSILNKNYDYGLMIDSVSEYGFALNNGVRTIGPMIIFPKTMLSWNVASSTNMTEESFSLLLNLEPRLDILVIGLDDAYPFNAPFLQNIKDLFRKNKILTEILPIYHACSTFNFLNAEHRYVAGALIPPKIKYVEELLLQEKHESFIMSGVGGTKLEDYGERDPLIDDPLRSRELKEKQIKDTYKIRSPWKAEGKLEEQSTSSNKDNKTSEKPLNSLKNDKKS